MTLFMFQQLFELSDSNCQTKNFYDCFTTIILTIFGAEIFKTIRRLVFREASEYTWMLFCHTSLFGLGFILSLIHPLYDRNFIWNDWPCQSTLPSLNTYFWLQASFYTHLLIM